MSATRVYAYVKRPPRVPRKFSVRISPHRLRWISGGLAAIAFAVGLGMIGSIFWPIIQWQIVYLPRQPQNRFASPIPRFASPVALGQSETVGQALAAETTASPSAVPPGGDSFKVSDWYPGAAGQSLTEQKKVHFYRLSIPKLNIDKALVEFGGDDLTRALIGWGTSGIPGLPGNNIIFGHSALPQFYNPGNYRTIFSLLPTLAPGDSLYIDYDGVSYKYKVFEMTTVEPEDYSVLEQKFDDSYLTLITCVPPGTLWKRLIVRSRLTKFD